MAEGEDWQDRISSQNIEEADSKNAEGSAKTKDEAESWQDRISSGVKEQKTNPDPLAGLTAEQKQTLLLIKNAMSGHKKWLAKKSGGKQADFSKKAFEGQNLEGWQLAKTVMAGTNLTGSTLKGADLTEADMFLSLIHI